MKCVSLSFSSLEQRTAKTRKFYKQKQFWKTKNKFFRCLPQAFSFSVGTEWNMLRETWFIRSIRRRRRHFSSERRERQNFYSQTQKRLSFILFLLCIKNTFYSAGNNFYNCAVKKNLKKPLPVDGMFPLTSA